jgi:hypothetical protein
MVGAGAVSKGIAEGGAGTRACTATRGCRAAPMSAVIVASCPCRFARKSAPIVTNATVPPVSARRMRPSGRWGGGRCRDLTCGASLRTALASLGQSIGGHELLGSAARPSDPTDESPYAIGSGSVPATGARGASSENVRVGANRSTPSGGVSAVGLVSKRAADIGSSVGGVIPRMVVPAKCGAVRSREAGEITYGPSGERCINST